MVLTVNAYTASIPSSRDTAINAHMERCGMENSVLRKKKTAIMDTNGITTKTVVFQFMHSVNRENNGMV